MNQYQTPEYIFKMGIGTTCINDEHFPILMLDHIDFDSLLRTAAIFELIKPTLKPFKPEQPLFFEGPTDIMGIDTELSFTLHKINKMVTLKLESNSNLNDLLERLDKEVIRTARKHLSDSFFHFNTPQKYLNQQVQMAYSGIYKDSYRNFIKGFEEKGFFLIILGNEGQPIPGIQLIKEDLILRKQ